jgi:hypothetical protein
LGAIALLLASVAIPAASAKPVAGVKLSVLPLPASAIGPDAELLPLQPDSGVVPNTHVHMNGRGTRLIPTRSAHLGSTNWVTLGRISGYALDYGLGASGGAGVTEVYTSVDQYKTRGDAKQGLALWEGFDVASEIPQPGQGGLTFGFTAEALAPVGSGQFAFLAGYSAANIAPVFGLDEQFTEGRYEADVTVWAGNAAAATTLAQSLAKKLDTRSSGRGRGSCTRSQSSYPRRRRPAVLPVYRISLRSRFRSPTSPATPMGASSAGATGGSLGWTPRPSSRAPSPRAAFRVGTAVPTF